MAVNPEKTIVGNHHNGSREPLFQDITLYLLVLRWSVLLASAVIYIITIPETASIIHPLIIYIILIFINSPITFFILKFKPYQKKTFLWILILDVAQGTLAVILTGGYSSLFFVLYLLSFFETGIYFNWQKAAAWIVSIDGIQVAATTLHWTASRAPVSTYELANRFISLLIVGLIVILLGELLRREKSSQERALLYAENFKKLNEIFTELESAGFDKERIFETLIRNIPYIGNMEYAFIVSLIDHERGLWEIKTSSSELLYPPGKIISNPVNDKLGSFMRKKFSTNSEDNQVLFKADAIEVTEINLFGVEEDWEELLIIGKSNSSSTLADEEFFLKALALETQLILHNTYLFQKKQEQIRNLDEFKEIQSTFFSAAGHEIKTPLTILKTLQSTLEYTISEPTDNQKEILVTMKSNIDRLDSLTTDILETAKLESSDLIIHCKEMDLIKVLRHRVLTMKPLADKKNQKILLRTIPFKEHEEIPSIWADRKRVSEIISNLLSNALKFSPENSTVIINVSVEKDLVETCVYDKGPELSREDEKNIFKKYFTSSSDKALTGFGLGLYITKKLVELHHGTIRIEKRSRWKGLCFTLPIFSEETYDGSEYSENSGN